MSQDTLDDIDVEFEIFDDIQCSDTPCLGTGWVKVMDDTWEECGVHYHGQLHPLSRQLLLDDPKLLNEEEICSHLRWKIKMNQKRVTELAMRLNEEQAELSKYELELVKRTPTLKMPAVRPNVSIIIVDE